jgi:hypothetical protein
MAKGSDEASRPFAPSPAAAPFMSLGYREAAADLMYVRMLGYFVSEDSTGDGVADLAEAVATLDPSFVRVYDLGANAMMLAHHGVDQRVYMRAIRLLEAGMKQFPRDWRLPYLAGQIYAQDLVTEDPAERRRWDERSLQLVESAIRKPGAPANAATWTATMYTKLGAHARAVASLKEMLLITDDRKARERLIGALARLEDRDAHAVEAEVFAERKKFERRWRAERATVPASMYLLIGPRLTPGFDMVELATGGVDLFVAPEPELEPLE